MYVDVCFMTLFANGFLIGIRIFQLSSENGFINRVLLPQILSLPPRHFNHGNYKYETCPLISTVSKCQVSMAMHTSFFKTNLSLIQIPSKETSHHHHSTFLRGTA